MIANTYKNIILCTILCFMIWSAIIYWLDSDLHLDVQNVLSTRYP